VTQLSAGVVLNVDDNDAARYVKTRVLRMAGFEVLEAADGAAALALLQSRRPELVLLDVRLPDVDGRELAARIKADPSLASIAVLQTSASHVESKHRIAALDAGADGYLVEPIEPEELVANVRALLRMRRAERERQAALEALQEADRRKDEFLAMLAHELRNPLAPIRNAVEILRLSSARPVRERARELIGRQVVHLARLVDDLLDVSRITQRKIVLQRQAVSLAAIIDAAVELAAPLIAERKQEFAVTKLDADVWLNADGVRLSQVIGNLLHNASKFTPREGRLRLEATRDAQAVRIAVTDNGEGIASEFLPVVFDLFSQSDRTLERTGGGLGIGLSLVKGLVELHGGRVSAESAGAGKGSRFVIELPLATLEAPAPMRRAAPAPAGNTARRVLVVEDNEDAAEAMAILLRELGHEVAVIDNGREAVEAARMFRPDVILLDIGLPGVDGFELARRFRALPETQSAKVIAVTGYGQTADRERSKASGFDLHLVKPVDPAKLTRALEDTRA
jgi:signal transduction histidine kinase